MQPLVERLFLAVMLGTAPLRASAKLFCYAEAAYCNYGNVTVLKEAQRSIAVKQCCVYNEGRSYRISNSEGCSLCVVYGFFATDGGKLLRNASVSEGRGREGLTFYFGVLKGLPPSIRKVRFKTNAGQEAVISNAESKKYDIVPVTWPYLTPQCVRFPVTMHRVSSNVTLEGNDVIWINPQLSSTGENEFVVPLHVAIVNTNVVVVQFSSSAYYAAEASSTATLTIVTVNTPHPDKPVRFRLVLQSIDDNGASDIEDIGAMLSNNVEINVTIDVSRYNFTSAGFAVRLELDDKSQAYSVDLKGRNLTYVYFNKSIVVGFTVSEMNVTAKHSIEICVHVIHPLPGMGPITMTISSAPRSENKSMVTLSESSDNKSMVTLSESRPVSCIQRRDTPHAGLVIYSLSSKDTRQPLDIFPDMLTVTVT
eukprot:Em0010g191a